MTFSIDPTKTCHALSKRPQTINNTTDDDDDDDESPPKNKISNSMRVDLNLFDARMGLLLGIMSWFCTNQVDIPLYKITIECVSHIRDYSFIILIIINLIIGRSNQLFNHDIIK